MKVHPKTNKTESNRFFSPHNHNKYKFVLENFSKYSHKNELINRDIEIPIETINREKNLTKNNNILTKSIDETKINNNFNKKLFNSDLIIQAREFSKLRKERQNSKDKTENFKNFNLMNNNKNQIISNKINKMNNFENKLLNPRTDNISDFSTNTYISPNINMINTKSLKNINVQDKKFTKLNEYSTINTNNHNKNNKLIKSTNIPQNRIMNKNSSIKKLNSIEKIKVKTVLNTIYSNNDKKNYERKLDKNKVKYLVEQNQNNFDEPKNINMTRNKKNSSFNLNENNNNKSEFQTLRVNNGYLLNSFSDFFRPNFNLTKENNYENEYSKNRICTIENRKAENEYLNTEDIHNINRSNIYNYIQNSCKSANKFIKNDDNLNYDTNIKKRTKIQEIKINMNPNKIIKRNNSFDFQNSNFQTISKNNQYTTYINNYIRSNNYNFLNKKTSSTKEQIKNPKQYYINSSQKDIRSNKNDNILNIKQSKNSNMNIFNTNFNNESDNNCNERMISPLDSMSSSFTNINSHRINNKNNNNINLYKRREVDKPQNSPNHIYKKPSGNKIFIDNKNNNKNNSIKKYNINIDEKNKNSIINKIKQIYMTSSDNVNSKKNDNIIFISKENNKYIFTNKKNIVKNKIINSKDTFIDKFYNFCIRRPKFKNNYYCTKEYIKINQKPLIPLNYITKLYKTKKSAQKDRSQNKKKRIMFVLPEKISTNTRKKINSKISEKVKNIKIDDINKNNIDKKNNESRSNSRKNIKNKKINSLGIKNKKPRKINSFQILKNYDEDKEKKIFYEQNNNNKITKNDNKNNNCYNIKLRIKEDVGNFAAFLKINKIKDMTDYNEIKEKYEMNVLESLIQNNELTINDFLIYFIQICKESIINCNQILLYNLYIRNIIKFCIDNLSFNLDKKFNNEIIKILNDVPNICCKNYYMFEILGYLIFVLLEHKIFDITNFNKFGSKDELTKMGICKVIKFIIVSDGTFHQKYYDEFKELDLFKDSKFFFKYIVKEISDITFLK